MENNTKCSRREFVSSVGKSALTFAVLAPVLGSFAGASSRSAPVPIQPVTLDVTKPGYTVLGTTGGALKIPDPNGSKKPIIVVRTSETGVAAYSSKCPHFGCEVPLPVNNSITCPCHDSVFDGNGKVTHGPAKVDLHSYSAVLEGTIITIKESAGA